jgi:poly-gamma-glutamate synthesis protein (capsule biosynthesis protein)
VRLFGFVPDPAMPEYPFHPESRNTMIARLEITAFGVVAAAALPLWIDADARPVPVAGSARGREIESYIRRITAEAGFDTTFDEIADGLSIRLEGAAA